MKKTLLIALLVLLALLCSACVQQDAGLTLQQAYSARERAMEELYQNVLWEYSTDGSSYPEEYAGHYYRAYPPKLVVCLTDEAEKEKYISATTYPEHIEFEIVQYNMNTLLWYMPIVQRAYDIYFDHIIVAPEAEGNCLMVRALKGEYEEVRRFPLEELGIAEISGMLQFGMWYW